MNQTKIFAHRGASGYAPENTLEAFKLAIAQGADGIELDVQLTSDGIPVVIHDEILDRVTSKKGFVKDYTLKELKKLIVLEEKFPEYTSSTIPTLEEVLDVVKTSDILVNIELKTSVFWFQDIEAKVIRIVEAAGMRDRVIYSSFNHYSIQKIREIEPTAQTAYLYSDVILNVADYARKTGVNGLHPSICNVKMADFLNEYIKSGLDVRVWTVNKETDMKWLIDAGVTAIITNYPDRAIKIKE